MRYTKYYPNYGHVTIQSGGSLSDLWNTFFSGNATDVLKEAVKSSALDIAKSGIKAAGNRIGSRLANKIAPKPVTNQVDQEMRKSILKELKLYDEKPAEPTQYGFGKKRKIRGSGLKQLF